MQVAVAHANAFKVLYVSVTQNINPILHTPWFPNHVLTLEKNTAKYCLSEAKNPVF